MRTVAITGIGAVSPFGAGTAPLWRGIVGPISCIAPTTRFDSSSFSNRVAGQVEDSVLDTLIAPHTSRSMAHSTRLMHGAAKLALADSVFDRSLIPKSASGVFIGTALGGWREGERQSSLMRERGTTRVNQLLVTGAGCYAAAVDVAELVGAQGEHLTISNGCPSALQAISLAASKIAAGDLVHCVAGGTESPLSPTIVAALARSGELSTETTHPGRASAPFDSTHCGMVLSEGATALVLEPMGVARERDAHVHAVIVGGSASCDAIGLYGMEKFGEAGATAIHALLRRNDLSPEDIDYVCAHANSSPAFDRKEAVVLRRAFGEFAAKIPVSSIKGVLGHPFGASGAFQTAAAAMAIQNSLIPPTYNLENPDPECDLDLVMGEPRKKTIRHALVTSYGYGGVNAYLLLRNPNL